MYQKYDFRLLLVFLSLLLMGFQCDIEKIRPKPVFEFSEKISLRPYKKTYKVGDTIWIEFQTADKSLFDKISQNKILKDTTFLRAGFSFRQLYPSATSSAPILETKIDNTLNIEYESASQGFYGLSFKTDCANSRYFIKFGILPKQSGIFSIQPTGAINPCENKQIHHLSSFTFLFDLADCNKDVWLSIPNSSRGGQLGITDVSIDNKELFVYKVQ